MAKQRGLGLLPFQAGIQVNNLFLLIPCILFYISRDHEASRRGQSKKDDGTMWLSQISFLEIQGTKNLVNTIG